MKQNVFVITLLLWCAGIQAQGISYNLATVPEDVKKNASVITQLDEVFFEVSDIDRASLNVHQVLTVVNEDGKRALSFAQYTSRYVSLDDAEIKVYDANGKQISRIKKKDMRTVANGEGLIEDGYVTYYTVPTNSYPVTVEYTWSQKFKGTLSYPSYGILTSGEGVVSSSFTAKVPKDLDLRYKEKNISLPPQVKEEGNYKIYHWSVKNMAPVEYEAGGPDDRYPHIELAPNRFYYYGYKGDLSSWKSFGQWIAELYKGLDELPEERKAFFRDLVKNAGSDREKIRIIYNYMQGNFRYVSIQLGIGGLKPFSATFTDQKKYGDCKALSNYVKAALKAVDINSHVAIINAEYNRKPVDPDFPDNNFNHVILCVPQGKDSIWLECTSKTADFGVLGTFTENRNALLITEQGGVLVPTPESRSGNNKFLVTTTVTLEDDGSGRTNTMFKSTGRFREQMDYILNEKKDDQKESIVFGIGFKQPDVFELSKKEMPEMHAASLDMEIEKVPEFSAGNKMFISPRLYKLWPHKLPKADNRRLDFYFHEPFEHTDTTIIKLPAGFTSDALPKPKSLSCPHATYTTKYWYDEQQKAVYSTAQLVLQQHRIPAADYAAVKKFFDDVLMDDTQRIVIRKE